MCIFQLFFHSPSNGNAHVIFCNIIIMKKHANDILSWQGNVLAILTGLLTVQMDKNGAIHQKK